MGHVYHHLYEIDMIHLRFFTVYGPRQRPDLAIHKFAKIIQENGKIPFYGDGSSAREYTYIDDIIYGIIKSIHYLERNKNVYEIIKLGENEVINLNEMLSTLEENRDKKAHKNHKKKLRDLLRKKNTDLHKIPPYVCLMKNIISRSGGDFNVFLRNFGQSFGRGGKEM